MVQLDTSWLQHVQKPARYTGGEYNSIVKDHSTVDVTMALAFPDVYEVAMSHLGIKILYGLVNRRDDAAAERVFAPWHDMEEEMRKRNIPLFSLETRTPISFYTSIRNELHKHSKYARFGRHSNVRKGSGYGFSIISIWWSMCIECRAYCRFL